MQIGLVLHASLIPSMHLLQQPADRSRTHTSTSNLTPACYLVPVCAQSIEEAVNNGGGVANTMRAGRTGSATAWAAGQRNDIFNVVDFAASPTSGRFGK
jgi:hypothetical protein